ncbi:MAG: SIMPL domain-containing protein [Chloroflexota bacterium]
MRSIRYLIIPVVVTVTVLGSAVALGGRAASYSPTAAAQNVPAGNPSGPFAGITVTGTGTASAAPDVAYISAGVTTQAAAAKQASDTNSTSMTAVIAAIKAAGVADKDIQTGNFSINPVYSQNKSDTGVSTITAYRVDNSVNVTVGVVGTAARVLDAAVTAGANSNVSIRFGIKDATALQEQALTAAMQQAAGKAGAIATAAGAKLNGAYSVTEQSSGLPTPMGLQAASVASSAAVPVEQGQLAVRAMVQVTYAYTR